MPSTTDIRTYSKHLLQHLQRLDALLDRVSASSERADDVDAIARESQTILDELIETRSSLLAAVGDGPTATLDPATVRRSIALSVAELPFEPAVQALGEVPRLAEKVKTRSSSNAVLLVPLCLAYRHCVEALMPLTAAVDPRSLRATST